MHESNTGAYVPRVFIVISSNGIVRGHAYVQHATAKMAAKEADEDYVQTRPHRVVPFVPEVRA